MDELVAAAAEEFAAQHTTPFAGPVAAAAAWTAANADSPQMMAGLAEARLLEALVVTSRAQRVLEIGTFTAVGALTIAAALPPGGRLTSLEFSPENAEVARRHLATSPHGEKVEVIVGDANASLAGVEGPFDLVWIDADKVSYPAYYAAVKPKLAPHGVIAADNLFRAGRTLDPTATDPNTDGIRRYATAAQDDPAFHNVLLTIGDGVMLSWRAPA